MKKLVHEVLISVKLAQIQNKSKGGKNVLYEFHLWEMFDYNAFKILPFLVGFDHWPLILVRKEYNIFFRDIIPNTEYLIYLVTSIFSFVFWFSTFCQSNHEAHLLFLYRTKEVIVTW